MDLTERQEGNAKLADSPEGCKHYIVHNGTWTVFAHSSTRGDSFTNFRAWLKPSRVKDRQRFSLKSLRFPSKKSCVVMAICIHRLPEWTPSCTDHLEHRHPPSTSTTSRPVTSCSGPSPHSRIRSAFGYFAEKNLSCKS